MEEDIPQVAANVNSVAEERIYIANEGIEDIERFKNAVFEQIKWGNWIFMVAEVDRKIVGHFNLQIGYPAKRKHTAYIGTILTKEYRNLGIGTEMMKIIMEMAKEKEVEKVFLSVFSINTGAINYYKKCGFEIEGVLKKQFKIDEKYVDEVYMAKWL
jgi:RimJ/RimL family protein N-acetyltransferase